MIARARKLYRRWHRARVLRRVQAEMAAWIPSVRDMPFPRFYRHYLRGSRKLGQAMRDTALTADEAGQALAQLSRAMREAEPDFSRWPAPIPPTRGPAHPEKIAQR